MNKLMKKKKKGFTLIELIAVVAILAILAAVAIPRVISYVDKSKRVAVQTEATTIYNAAEAAYNDGKLTLGNKKFDELGVKDVVKSLNGEQLLSNDDTSKVCGAETGITLGKLKEIMNTDESKIEVNSEGQFTGFKDTSNDTTQNPQ